MKHRTLSKSSKYSLPLLLLISPALWATSAPTTDEDNITVWASPITNTSAIIPAQTFQSLDTRNVAEALSLLPGVTLQKAGPRNEYLIRLRGFDSRQVPVFYDGVPVYIPYDGNLDLSRFLTRGLSSVEVSKGYSSFLQGPNQMGGAVNITTQKPQKELEIQADYRHGWANHEGYAYDTYLSLGTRNDLGYLQLSAARLNQDYSPLPNGVKHPLAGQNGQRTNSASDDNRVLLKVGLTPRLDDDYSLTYSRQEGEKNSPPYIGVSKQVQSNFWQWPQYDKESFYYQGFTQLTPELSLKSRAYHDRFKNTLLLNKSLKELQNKTGNYSHYDDYSQGVSLQLAQELRELDILSLALHWKDDMHREKGMRNAPFDRYQDRLWSIATEYQWAALQDLDLVAGFSYDWRKSLEGMKHEKNGSITYYQDNHPHAFNWQLMGKYRFENRDTLSLSLADRSRFPTLKERYTTSRPAYGQIALINPGLKPERARTLDLTYNGHLNKEWGYEASLYYNWVEDAILARNIDAKTVQNRNSGRVDYAGFDLGIHGKIEDWLSVGLNYSLIHARVKQNEVGKITGLPTHTLTSWVTLSPWEPLSLTLSEQVRSTTYSDSDGLRRTAGFGVTHLRADYTLGKGVSLNLSVNNVFDRAYYYTEGFVEEGRSVWTGVEYRF